MKRYLSDSQLAYEKDLKDKFFSPEAVALRNDPVLGEETQELALIDHLLRGWKHLQDQGIDNRSGKPISKLALGVDDQIKLPEKEILNIKKQQVDSALNNLTGDLRNRYPTLSSEQLNYVKSLLLKHIAKKDIGEIGGLGTSNRKFPKDYHDQSKAGTVIPVSFEPGQKQDRGVKILLDKAQDPSLYGIEVDAMHVIPAAEDPSLISDINNIKLGPRALNQSDGRRSGPELINSRKQHSQEIYRQLFELENGVPVTQKGVPLGDITDPETIKLLKQQAKQTRDEAKLVSQMSAKEKEEELSEHFLEQKIEELLSAYKAESDTLKDSNIRSSSMRNLVERMASEDPRLRAILNKSAGEISTEDRGKAVNIFADEVHLNKGINGNGRNGQR